MAWAMNTLRSNPIFPKDLFPSILVQMVHIGEDAGALAQLLEKAALDHENRLTHQVESMTQLIEPLMVVVLGGLVGGLVVALYLPVFQLGQIM
jgi:type IV pilus assembly protein PilC